MLNVLGAFKCTFVDSEQKEVDYYRLLIGESNNKGGYSVDLVKTTAALAQEIITDGVNNTANVNLLYDKYGRVVDYRIIS